MSPSCGGCTAVYYARRYHCPAWADIYVGMPMLGLRLAAGWITRSWTDRATADDAELAALLDPALLRLWPGNPKARTARMTASSALHRHVQAATVQPARAGRVTDAGGSGTPGHVGPDTYAADVRNVLRAVSHQYLLPEPGVLHELLAELVGTGSHTVAARDMP